MGETESVPAGWYPQADGRLRWWSGTAWTNSFQEQPPVMSGEDERAVRMVLHLREARRRAVRSTWIGAVILALGAILTVATYAASEPGGSYFVFWGAIVFGGWRVARGMYLMAHPEKLLR